LHVRKWSIKDHKTGIASFVPKKNVHQLLLCSVVFIAYCCADEMAAPSSSPIANMYQENKVAIHRQLVGIQTGLITYILFVKR